MPQITPLELPQNDALQKVWEVVNHNAKLMLVDGTVDEQGILSYETKSGEQIQVDLSAFFLTRTEYAKSDPSNGSPASENKSGPIAIIGIDEIKDTENPDDFKAMTMAKTLILINDLGLPQFDATGSKKGDMLIFDGERYSKTTFGVELLAAMKNPTSDLQKALCVAVAKCTTGGGTNPTPTDPISAFTTIHYIFVDDVFIPDPTYDYIVADGFGGTFDTLSETTISWWAMKLGVGGANVDVKMRKKGSLAAMTVVAQNLPPNLERQDVVDAPGINTPNGILCGRQMPIPVDFRTGEEIEVHLYIAGTSIELKSSPRYIKLDATNQPIEGAYRIIGNNADAGGMAQQQKLQQLWIDQEYRDVVAQNWVVQGEDNNLIAGVTIPNGLLQATAASVSQTTFVQIGCQPVGKNQFVSAKRQIVKTGCVRPSGLTTFTATWNIAPKNQNAHRFDSLDQANNEMGAYYDQPTQYNVGQFPFQAAKLAVGEAVYNRADTNSCERVDDGNFHLSDSNGDNTIKKSGRFASGVIVELKDTQYTTPQPIPDTSWATVTDPFDASNPNYFQSNGTVWNWGNGMACVNVNNMVRGDTGALIFDIQADRILALITVGARDVTDPRYGVGLKYSRDPDSTQGATGGLGGYNLLISKQNGVNQIIFLDDHRAFGPGYPYDWQPNTQYYVEMQYSRPDANTRRLLGRVWKVSENQPTSWPYSWDVASRSGQAAIVGGSNYPGAGNVAAGCVTQVWLQQVNTTLRLINVALGRPVTAPANTLNGGFDARFVTDNTDLTYSTDCLLETDPVSVVVDLYGLAQPEQVQIKPRNDYPNAMPVDFTVDGSLDGKAWSNLLSIVNLTRGPAELTYNLPSVNGVFGQFRYMRIHATRIGMAEPTDCRRLQINEFRVLAPEIAPLPADQIMSILEVARAFVGVNNARDLMYFVKLPADSTDQPTYGFNNTTTNFPNDLAGNHTIGKLSANNTDYPNTDWYTALNQARKQGFTHFIWATDGDAGQTMRFRFKGNPSDTRYIDFDFIGPADGTILDLKTIFPV